MAETGKKKPGKGSGSSRAGKTGTTAKSARKRVEKDPDLAAIVKKLSEPLVFGLDIGTRSIVGTVGYRMSSGEFVVVAQVSRAHETRAMLDGQIHDIQAVADTILQVRQSLETMIGRKLSDVCIAAAGRVLKTVTATAEMEFPYETVITNEHIYSLDMLGVEKAYEILRKEQRREDIHFYCVGYSVIRYYQNAYPITNLEGHKANAIQTELIATFLPDEVVDGLYAAVEKAGLFVANLTLEPIAAMNVAIPEQFRLLNIALVDVGAGTSDISITKDGSIVAYGMIPSAGDEITESLAKRYLLDFPEAERMKCQGTTHKQVSVHDIMGLAHRISAEEIAQAQEPVVREITQKIAEQIRELNGGKSVSAVFLVGGGGKVRGFAESLAKYLELPQERVALRGAEVMRQIQFLQKSIKVDSLLVTPVGICLNYYEQKNNFIFVTFNGERIKLYDNSRLTVMDAAMQVGFPNEDLFPKRGAALNYYVNGEKRMRRGEPGDSAVIRVNGQENALSTALAQNDRIEVTASTEGSPAALSVGRLPEYHAQVHFTFNKKEISCPCFVKVNGELVSEYYEIQEGDRIEILEYYTLEQVLEFMDILSRGKIYVNNVIADLDARVYDNFSISCEILKEEPDYQALMREYGDGQVPDAVREGRTQEAQESEEEAGYRAEDSRTKALQENGEEVISTGRDLPETDDRTPQRGSQSADGNMQPEGHSENDRKSGHPAAVTVNGETVTLRGKQEYILVDVLDFYPFDLSVARGDRLETLVNRKPAEFTTPVHAGDEIKIGWV